MYTFGRIDREQIRSRINNNDCRTFRPRRPLSTAYRTHVHIVGHWWYFVLVCSKWRRRRSRSGSHWPRTHGLKRKSRPGVKRQQQCLRSWSSWGPISQRLSQQSLVTSHQRVTDVSLEIHFCKSSNRHVWGCTHTIACTYIRISSVSLTVSCVPPV